MTTTRTYIIVALCAFLPPLIDAWKLIPEDVAGTQINIWLDFDFPMYADWVASLGTWRVIAFIMSLIMVIDSRGKDPIKKGFYWTLLIIFSFEIYRYLLNCSKDNYFYIYFFTPSLPFLIAAAIRYHKRNDIVFSVKRWFYNLFKKNDVTEVQ